MALEIAADNPDSATDNGVSLMYDNTLDTKKSHDLYALVRSKIEHEDTLVNQRLMWAFTLNGFLLAAYAGSFAIEASILTSSPLFFIQRDHLAENLKDLRLLVMLVGAGSGFLALLGSTAAYRAIMQDSAFLYEKLKERNHIQDFPYPIGTRHSAVIGLAAGVFTPSLLIAMWIAISREFYLPSGLLLPLILAIACAGYAIYPIPKDLSKTGAGTHLKPQNCTHRAGAAIESVPNEQSRDLAPQTPTAS